MMKEECINAVRVAAGELKLSDVDIEHIEHHIRIAWEQEGVKQAGFADLPLDQQIKRVSKKAKSSFFSDSDRYKPYELLSTFKGENQVTELGHRLAHHATSGGSIEMSIKGLRSKVFDRFKDYHTYGTKAFGFKNDVNAHTELLRALRGDKGVNPEALKLASIFHETMDFLVKEAKAVGIKFNPRDNYTPQPMDFRKISLVTKDEFVDRTLPRLDWAEYQKRGLDNEGSLRQFVEDVYETLASEGRNKVIASGGKDHSGISLGGRLRQVRQLHYTPQGLVEAMKEFGSDLTVEGMMSRSFDNLIRDIAIAREFGANANENFNFVLASMFERDREDINSRLEGDKKTKALNKLKKEEMQVQMDWDGLTMGRKQPSTMDKIVDSATAWMVITKLGSQSLYIPKEIIESAFMGSQRMGYTWKTNIANIWNASPVAGKERKEFIKSITVGLEHMATGFTRDLETNSQSVLGVMAKKTMDWLGLTTLDNMMVRGLSATLQDYVGGFTRNFKDMDSLKKKIGEQSFKSIIDEHRFNERDLKLLSLADTESFKGKGTYLTDKNIYRIDDTKLTPFLKKGEDIYRLKSDLANKYRTFIWSTVQEHARGSVGSTIQDKRWITGKDGSVNNLARLMGQFLVMPISWSRMHLIEIPSSLVGVSSQVYRAKALVIGILGEELIRKTLVPLISGKEPQLDFSDPTEYIKALINGITHYERFSPFNSSGWDVLGPWSSQAGKLAIAGKEAVWDEGTRKQRGKAQAQFGKELVNTFVPFQNLWYARGAFNHFVRNSIDDVLNPGGRARAEVYRQRQKYKKQRKRNG
ncbi:hypothetical protein Q7M56_05450 (plasmid) [Candidatus Liberibacter asiaticus]